MESIVSEGLLLNLDAGNTASYSGSGTSWIDLSGNGFNGTLVASPTYNSTDGFFTFDGTNQYVDCGNSSTLQITEGSVSAWIKIPTTGNNSFRGIITKQNAWGLFSIDRVLCAFDWGNYYNTAPVFDINQGIRSTGINIGTDNWTNVAMTFEQTIGVSLPGPPNNNVKIYINGSLVLTTTTLHRDHTAPIQFAGANFAGQYLSGSLAQGLVYNKVLTPEEILNNYNVTKSRFGL